MLGYKFADRDVVRFSWGELSFRRGIGLALIHSDEQWMLHLWPLFLNLYIYLAPSRSQPKRSMQDSWGFVWYFDNEMRSSPHFTWGDKYRIINMPWDWSWVRTSWLLNDQKSWLDDLLETRIGGYVNYRDRDDLYRIVEPYTYTLKSGEVQHRLATVVVEEMEWRWRLGTPWPRKIRRSIDVRFDGEVGERSGSWKGGCIGCGYDLRPGEDPLECLRRMELERSF